MLTAAPPPIEASPPPAPRPRRILPLALVGLVVVAAVAGAAVVLAGPLGGWLLGRSATSSLKLIPAEAPMVLHVAPTAAQVKNFDTLKARFEAIPEFKTALTRLEQSINDDPTISFQKDIQPWLGPELAVALTGFPAQTGDEPQVVVLLSTLDRAKSNAFMQKLKSTNRKGETTTERQYNGVTILTNSKDSWLASVNDFVVLSTTEKTLQRTIDLAQGKGGKSLSEAPGYQEIAKALPTERFADVYVDVAATVVEAGRSRALEASQLQSLTGLRSLAMALRFEPNGVSVDAVALYDQAKLTPEQMALINQKPNALRALTLLPSKTVAFVALHDLRSIWQAASLQLRADRSFNQGLESFRRSTGLGVDEDIMGWMTGEVALAVTKNQTPLTIGRTAVPYNGLLAIEATDRALVDQKLTKIREALAKSGLRPTTQQIKGIDAHHLALGRGAPTIVFGYIGDFLVVALSPEGFAQAIDSKTDSVTSAPSFQQTSASLAKERTALVYTDGPALYELLDSMGTGGDSTLNRQAEAVVRPIKAVGLVGTPLKDNTVRSQLFILIAD